MVIGCCVAVVLLYALASWAFIHGVKKIGPP
jgi:hypothetical protein